MLTYLYMDKTVEIKATKSDFCEGYNLTEHIPGYNDMQIIAGPYPNKKAALQAGRKYIEAVESGGR